MDKQWWRAEARRARAALHVDSAAHRRALASFLAAQVPDGRAVVIYHAMAGEVDLAELVASHADRWLFAVTRTPEEGHTLTLHPNDAAMEQHPYGYRQPVPDAAVVSDGHIAAVLVPALAFDRRGVRLGRGKGYYDRLLSRLGPDTLFIGVTGGYIVESLPQESFDVAMTHLVTESGVFPAPLGPEHDHLIAAQAIVPGPTSTPDRGAET